MFSVYNWQFGLPGVFLKDIKGIRSYEQVMNNWKFFRYLLKSPDFKDFDKFMQKMTPSNISCF